tara:strand:- start:32138 stop:32392 length:255 start_codon:yes stop_codon:yes gene_type:complete
MFSGDSLMQLDIDNHSGKSCQSFNDYMEFLRSSLKMLSKYWEVTGRYHPYIKDIQTGLEHADPFIMHKASIAASMLLEDRKIYH